MNPHQPRNPNGKVKLAHDRLNQRQVSCRTADGCDISVAQRGQRDETVIITLQIWLKMWVVISFNSSGSSFSDMAVIQRGRRRGL